MAWQAGTGQHRAAGARRYRHAPAAARHARAVAAWRRAYLARMAAGTGGRPYGQAWRRRAHVAVRLAVRLGVGPYAGPGRHAAPHGRTGR